MNNNVVNLFYLGIGGGTRIAALQADKKAEESAKNGNRKT